VGLGPELCDLYIIKPEVAATMLESTTTLEPRTTPDGVTAAPTFQASAFMPELPVLIGCEFGKVTLSK